MTAISVPIVPSENGVARYLREIWRFPVLTAEEEYMLALRWREHGDVDAAHKLVTSHLRLVAKIAMKYRGYGLPVADLLSEGNIGLMKAVKKFEPERGFRLATYAIWWIKAAMTEYVLRSWSLVRMGTMAAQKKMFFNLRRLKSRLEILDNGDISVDEARVLAKRLDVSEEEIVDMNRRISSRDASLNTPGGDEEGMEFQDTLVDDSPSPKRLPFRATSFAPPAPAVRRAQDPERARAPHLCRTAAEGRPCHTGGTRPAVWHQPERVRQLEARAFEKVQNLVRENAGADASALAA